MKRLIKRIPIVNELAYYVHRYVKHKQGTNRIKKLIKVSPLRLVIGASGFYDRGWIDTDVGYLNLLNSKHWATHFHRNSIDAILAEHVWEHLTFDEGLEAAKRCFEYLRPGGYLRVAVPDGFHPNQDYIEYVKPGGSGSGAGGHKVLYNHRTFTEVFEKAGFRVVRLEYFDSEGEFHYADWNPQEGKIHRSRRFDERNKDGRLNYTSLILDACKDG
jgi:predicted SAM-dependent methyltransferase